MGNYNCQYQNYYKYMTHRKRPDSSYKKNYSNISNKSSFTYQKLIKKITYQVIGVLILSVFLMGCKVIVTPETKFIRAYSKRILNESFNYETALEELKNVKWSDIEKYSVDAINKINEKINDINTF